MNDPVSVNIAKGSLHYSTSKGEGHVKQRNSLVENEVESLETCIPPLSLPLIALSESIAFLETPFLCL